MSLSARIKDIYKIKFTINLHFFFITMKFFLIFFFYFFLWYIIIIYAYFFNSKTLHSLVLIPGVPPTHPILTGYYTPIQTINILFLGKFPHRTGGVQSFVKILNLIWPQFSISKFRQNFKTNLIWPQFSAVGRCRCLVSN